MKIAIPIYEGNLSEHFGHCQQFAIFEIDTETKSVVSQELHDPPAHEPGSLPAWLHNLEVTTVIAGGIGTKAIQFFQQYGIEVRPGAPVLPPDELVRQLLEGSLQTAYSPCNNNEHQGCGGH